jgi:hypothetical protein
MPGSPGVHLACAENCGLAGERYGAGRLATPRGEGAARAEGAVLVKGIGDGRQAFTEHPPADVAQQARP